ncbi:MAG: DUF7793 family protein [Bacteroidia bacterium]
MLTPPANTTIYDWPTSKMWFDDDGVLYSVPKPITQKPTKEETLIQLEEFKKLCGYKKVCAILITNSTDAPPAKEERDWAAEELNSIFKAMAIIATSPLSRMAANLFFGLKPPAYPTKFFSNGKDAKEWIKQYL